MIAKPTVIMKNTRNFALLLLLLLPATAFSQQTNQPAYPPDFPEAQAETYKTIGDVELRLWVFNPEEHQAVDRRPAIVFFFGGGWRGGTPGQFRAQCEYLADRGMVAIAADYRVSSRHGVKANECVADARSAMRWIRANSERLGIDPDRIAAGGGSAGGHLAVATACLERHDDPNDDLSVSARPDALVLFNPAVVLAPVPGAFELPEDRLAGLQERMGAEIRSMSPYHQVRPGMPPAIIFHGEADTTVPYRTIELFRDKMEDQGNRCTVVAYEGAGHGFFNFGRNDNAYFIDTVNKMDQFLVSLGYLRGAKSKQYGSIH